VVNSDDVILIEDSVQSNLVHAPVLACDSADFKTEVVGTAHISNAPVILAEKIPFGISSVESSVLSAQKIISLFPEHISCYMLILEEKTALYAKRDKLHFPSEEAIEQEYLKISKLFCDAGYSHYEISNFAKSDKMSKHNLKYWRTQEYIGIGPSAYSFVDGERFHYENDLKGFINSPKTVNDGEGGDLLEYVMLTLRLKEGLDEEKIKLRFSKRFSEKLKKTAEKFRENGFLTLENGVISFTSKGMLVSNSLITEFMEENMYEDL